MKSRNLVIAVAAIVGITLGSVLLPTKALAWHPEGKITKFVANETTGSASVDANTENTGVAAKPGDILRYTITIKNTAQPHSAGHNDLAFVELTDALPADVELVGNANQRTIKESIPGIIQPGKSVAKEYRVKVISTKTTSFKNRACFTGDSTVKDNKQQGCDDAYTKVTVTPKPEEPKPEQPKPEVPKPEQPKTPEMPASIPSTGPEAIIASALGIGALGYAGVNYRRSKKAVNEAYKR